MMITTSRQLGADLRNWRKQRRLTQAQVAESIGLAQKAVSALESHTGHVSIERLFQVLSALDLELVLRERQTPSPDDGDEPSSQW